MEVRRTYPPGYFANLKSLFISKVGRTPQYVPDVKLHFFEGSFDLFKNLDKWGQFQDKPNSTNPFHQQTTRCIWCDIDGIWVKRQPTRRKTYTLTYNLYRPDGTLLYRRTEQKLEFPWEGCDLSFFRWRTYGYGWREPGHWPTGKYQAEVLIDGVRSGTGHFTIAPPPPPKPADEVLQHPRVRFSASGRENIRFPHQTTREVSCVLTVRNLLYGEQARNYSVTVQCSTAEGSLLWESKPSWWWVTSQEQEPSISWSIQTSGWRQGIYRVEILIDGKDFAWGAFTIE